MRFLIGKIDRLPIKRAGVAELAYARALGARSRKGLRVQISPPAPFTN